MNCLNPDCKKEILTMGNSPAEGVFPIAKGESSKLEQKGDITFVRCPYCGARNIKEHLPPSAGTAFPWHFGRFDFEI
ncbi:MAG: hypothetical protein AB1442_13100 [Nitrospirota bacterium]